LDGKEEYRVHRTGELYGHFETLEQQKESATLGMWIFLVTEVLFFGGLFLAYTINRSAFSTAFGIGSNTLDITLGAGNTVVLIMSSLTMAMAVWSAQVGFSALKPSSTNRNTTTTLSLAAALTCATTPRIPCPAMI
jgi:heme/copper-type cytochrome/quinol oxidase subunit 3